MSTLAVVIPTRNMASTLGRALGSACHGGADEIVVVDDASEDDTAAVVERYQNEFPVVQYVRHPQKTEDHNVAQRDVWLGLKSDQVVGLAADDYLYPGAICAMKTRSHSPVVFCDADAVDEDGRYICAHYSHFYGDRTPEEIRERFRGDVSLLESGVGSALRMDMVRWLWHSGWASMGPMMDSIGYGAVACMFGASYLRIKGAAVTVRERSYGRNPDWTDDDFVRMGTTAVLWMQSVGLDFDTISGLARKRCRIVLERSLA